MTIKCPKCQSDNPDTATFCADCGTNITSLKDIGVTETLETPKEELTRGTTFADRYEIIEELGKGGMGRVFRVEDTKIGQDIALKLIKPEIASDKKTIERFRNELKTTRMISHRNVCRMFDLGDAEGTHFITMEYVPGEDLRSFIKRVGQLPSGKAISVAKQVCEGLAEAHRLGVVHRDLKSSNIMIDKEGNARIMDFGIARSQEARGLTGEDIIIGTPEYMSPEQAEGKGLDGRSDIYSLGVILFEMVIGQLPFQGDTPLSIVMKHKGEKPKDPKELNPQIPVDLSQLILKCMAKEKEDRFQSAGQLSTELNNIEAGIPSPQEEIAQKKPITSKEITVTFGLKKLLFPVIALIAVVIIGLILWQTLFKKETVPFASSGKPLLAIMYFQNNTGDESLDIWRDGLPRMLIADLSQSKYLTVLADDRIYGILSQLNLLEVEKYSTEDLKEVAFQGRSTHILRGILTKSGDSFRINTTLQESSSMEIVGSEMVEGKGEGSLHTMVDELTRRIKESFKLSEQEIAGDIDRDVGQITTSSPEAYKLYIEGKRYFNSGHNRESIESLKKAVSLDPEFALAYIHLGMSYYYDLELHKEGSEYMQRAIELSDRLSEREQYVIRGQFYSTQEKTYEKALEAYNKLSALYPDHEYANRAQGWLYFKIEEWDKAIDHLGFHIRTDVESINPHINLAVSYLGKGLYDRAREVIDHYLKNISDNDVVRLCSARIYYTQGKFGLALAEVDKVFSLNPTNYLAFRFRGDIYLYMGELNKAEAEYQKLLEFMEPEVLLHGRIGLTCLYTVKGKLQKAIDQAKRAIELSKKLGQKKWESEWHQVLAYLESENPEEVLKESDKAWDTADEVGDLTQQRRALHAKGLALLRMPSLDRAQSIAEELKMMIEQGLNKKHLRYYLHLMGAIEFNMGHIPEAIDYFERAIALTPAENSRDNEWDNQALLIDSLALAQYRSGNIEKAKEEYERITHLTTGRLYYGDVYAKSFYVLGKIYEQQGDLAQAIEHYEKFLDLWKDADPGLAEVEDVRKRLAKLKEA